MTNKPLEHNEAQGDIFEQLLVAAIARQPALLAYMRSTYMSRPKEMREFETALIERKATVEHVKRIPMGFRRTLGAYLLPGVEVVPRPSAVETKTHAVLPAFETKEMPAMTPEVAARLRQDTHDRIQQAQAGAAADKTKPTKEVMSAPEALYNWLLDVKKKAEATGELSDSEYKELDAKLAKVPAMVAVLAGRSRHSTDKFAEQALKLEIIERELHELMGNLA